MSESEKPRTLIAKIDNIWYHYKFVILIGLAALVMVSVSTCQMLSQKTADVYLYHISLHGLTLSSQASFKGAMAEIADDYNGDGKVIAEMKEETFVPREVAAYGEPTTIDSFNLELATGECVVFFLDESFYRGNRDYMADLADVFGETPEGAFDEKAFRLGDLPKYKTVAGLCDMDEDTYLCLRKQRVGMDQTHYDAHVRFFRALAAKLQ